MPSSAYRSLVQNMVSMERRSYQLRKQINPYLRLYTPQRLEVFKEVVAEAFDGLNVVIEKAEENIRDVPNLQEPLPRPKPMLRTMTCATVERLTRKAFDAMVVNIRASFDRVKAYIADAPLNLSDKEGDEYNSALESILENLTSLVRGLLRAVRMLKGRVEEHGNFVPQASDGDEDEDADE
ncbi:hypothetical protein HGRIS_014675 [Hohenbuehelia grisea]|uniref:Uncharacterized protein n=1 Tax=Hohenbuehelia grisea TaxID=104357 RepID=A0ABR3JUC3_9AGAR